MKNFNQFILTLLAAGLLASCSLTEEPTSFVNRKSFYKNESQCIAALNSCYMPANAIYTANFMLVTEACTDNFGYILWNNISCLNEHFDLRTCMTQHKDQWFADCYPDKVLADNCLAASLRHFPGFDCPHLPQPYLKSTFAAAWEKARVRLNYASKQKFRTWSDHTEWLMRYWQLASGQFVPYVRQSGQAISLDLEKEKIKETLLSTQNRVVCLNEGERSVDYLSRRAYLKNLFERVLPQKSAFEKD